jgi:large subunit ribosomal protein L21
MLAVIKTGGKQYTVQEGDTLKVEKMADLKDGESMTFDAVLLVGNADGSDAKVGTPTVSGAKVEAKVVEAHGRAKKLDVRKFKAKSRYYKRYGHRQPYTEVEITKISA